MVDRNGTGYLCGRMVGDEQQSQPGNQGNDEVAIGLRLALGLG